MASTSDARQPSTTKKLPNWLELPDELTANILQRLRKVVILKSARKVCTSWRRICKNPALWKVIVMIKNPDDRDKDDDMQTLTKQAVDLSCGELIDISISRFGNDELLDYIVQRSSKLNRLCLEDCRDITGSCLSQAVKMLPELEELNLYLTTTLSAEDIEVIGWNCPQLKTFKISKYFMKGPRHWDDNAFAIANSMPGLRHLDMNDKEMSNDGIEAIVDGCPLLEYFDVRWCFNIWLTEEYEQMCNERIKTFIYDSSEENMWSIYEN